MSDMVLAGRHAATENLALTAVGEPAENYFFELS